MIGALRGSAAVEVAMIAPLILLLLGGAVDFGLAYVQRGTLAMAAKAGAEAAALVLANAPLSGAAVPPRAVQAAESAARSAARDLDPNRIAVRVEWAGGSTVQVRQLPPYQVRLPIPTVENIDQTVDTRHTHRYAWSSPAFSQNLAQPVYRPGVWYLDRINGAAWTGFGFISQHPYPDRVTIALFGWPQGPAFGPAYPVGWMWGWWSTVAGFFDTGFASWDAWRWTNAVWAGAAAYTASWPYDAWRRTFTDAFGILDRYWDHSGQNTYGGTSDVGGSVFTFTYAVRRPDREIDIQALPAYQAVEQRPLRVTLTYPFTPATPILASILRGRILGARVTVTVTSAYGYP